MQDIAKREADNDNEREEQEEDTSSIKADEEDESVCTPSSDPQKPEISSITRQHSQEPSQSEDQVA